MFNDCIICLSGDAPNINNDIAAGYDDDAIAEKYRHSVETVRRHSEHVAALSVEIADHSNPETLLASLRRNAARLESAILFASAEDDRTLFLRSSAELTKNLALQNEIANRVHTESPLAEAAQIRSLARKMASALGDEPGLKDAVLKALRTHFGADEFDD